MDTIDVDHALNRLTLATCASYPPYLTTHSMLFHTMLNAELASFDLSFCQPAVAVMQRNENCLQVQVAEFRTLMSMSWVLSLHLGSFLVENAARGLTWDTAYMRLLRDVRPSLD